MQNSAFHSESDGPLECAKLPDRFIKHDTCCCRKIQASGLLPHGNCQAMLRVRGEQTLWQTLGFAPKNEMITVLEFFHPIGPLCFLRQKQESSTARLLAQDLKRSPDAHVTSLPVIHAGTAQGPFLKRKSQGFDKMKSRASSQA